MKNVKSKKKWKTWKIMNNGKMRTNGKCWDEHPLTTMLTPTTMTCWVMWQCWKKMLGWHAQIEKCSQVCPAAHVRCGCSFPFADGSRPRRVPCFSPCLCYTSNVAEWSDLLLRVLRDHCLFVHETRLSAVFKAPSLPSGRSHCWAWCIEHCWILTRQIVSECSEVWYALRIAESDSHRESDFTSTRHQQIIYHTWYKRKKKRKMGKTWNTFKNLFSETSCFVLFSVRNRSRFWEKQKGFVKQMQAPSLPWPGLLGLFLGLFGRPEMMNRTGFTNLIPLELKKEI